MNSLVEIVDFELRSFQEFKFQALALYKTLHIFQAEYVISTRSRNTRLIVINVSIYQ